MVSYVYFFIFKQKVRIEMLLLFKVLLDFKRRDKCSFTSPRRSLSLRFQEEGKLFLYVTINNDRRATTLPRGRSHPPQSLTEVGSLILSLFLLPSPPMIDTCVWGGGIFIHTILLAPNLSAMASQLCTTSTVHIGTGDRVRRRCRRCALQQSF